MGRTWTAIVLCVFCVLAGADAVLAGRLEDWCNRTLPAQRLRLATVEKLLAAAQQQAAGGGPGANMSGLGELEKQRMAEAEAASAKQRRLAAERLASRGDSDELGALRGAVDAAKPRGPRLQAGVRALQLVLKSSERRKKRLPQLLQVEDLDGKLRHMSEETARLERAREAARSETAWRLRQRFGSGRSQSVLTAALEDEAAYLALIRAACFVEERAEKRATDATAAAGTSVPPEARPAAVAAPSAAALHRSASPSAAGTAAAAKATERAPHHDQPATAAAPTTPTAASRVGAKAAATALASADGEAAAPESAQRPRPTPPASKVVHGGTADAGGNAAAAAPTAPDGNASDVMVAAVPAPNATQPVLSAQAEAMRALLDGDDASDTGTHAVSPEPRMPAVKGEQTHAMRALLDGDDGARASAPAPKRAPKVAAKVSALASSRREAKAAAKAPADAKDDDDDFDLAALEAPTPPQTPVARRPASRRTRRRGASLAQEAAQPTESPEDHVVYDDDDLPRHRRPPPSRGLAGGWRSFLGKAAPKAAPKPSADVAIMQSLFSGNGGLPQQYQAWKPSDGAGTSAAPSRTGLRGAAVADNGDDVQATSADDDGSASGDAAPVSFAQLRQSRRSAGGRRALATCKGVDAKVAGSRSEAAGLLLQKYAEALHSKTLQRLSQRNYGCEQLQQLSRRLKDADQLETKKPSKTESWCLYFQQNAAASKPLLEAAAAADAADAALAEGEAQRASISEEKDALAQLAAAVEQDVTGLSALLATERSQPALSRLAPDDAAHMEMYDALQATLQQRSEVASAHRSEAARVDGELAAVQQLCDERRGAAKRAQASLEAVRAKMSKIRSSCDSSLAALDKKRQQAHSEARAVEQATQVLLGGA